MVELSTRQLILACAATCSAALLAYRLLRSTRRELAHDDEKSPEQCGEASTNESFKSVHLVQIPVLGLIFDNKNFSQWKQMHHHIWYDTCEGDFTEVSPSAIVEYVLESRELDRPQINFVVEDLMTGTTAVEYVERSRQGMPAAAMETDALALLEDPESASLSGAVVRQDSDTDIGSKGTQLDEVDTCCCAFTEQGESCGSTVQRCVVNMVAIKSGVASILQLICRDEANTKEALLPLFRDICRSTIRQLQLPTTELSLRGKYNCVQFGLPSVRQEVPGLLLTLSVGRLKLISLNHPLAQLVYERFQSKASASPAAPAMGSSGSKHPFGRSQHGSSYHANMIACVEKRTNTSTETVETFLIQMNSKNHFERLVQDLPIDPLHVGRPCAVRSRSEFLCFVVAVAGTQCSADEHAQRVSDDLKPFSGHKRVVQYCHQPSGITYALPINIDKADPSPVFLTHFFGPFNFQVFPNGANCLAATSLRIAVKDIAKCGETFASFQRSATRDYDERFITRRPSVDGWCRLDVLTENSRGEPQVEHVTILEHQGHIVHLVWTCPPQGNPMTEDVRRNLHFPNGPL